MKRLTCIKGFGGLLVLGAAALLTGCTADTPAYTSKERFAQINRNLLFQSQAFNDDLDSDIAMLRPSDQLSIWNVYHRK